MSHTGHCQWLSEWKLSIYGQLSLIRWEYWIGYYYFFSIKYPKYLSTFPILNIWLFPGKTFARFFSDRACKDNSINYSEILSLCKTVWISNNFSFIEFLNYLFVRLTYSYYFDKKKKHLSVDIIHPSKRANMTKVRNLSMFPSYSRLPQMKNNLSSIASPPPPTPGIAL